MKTLLLTPASTIRRTGNRRTASEWVDILEAAGHEVTLSATYGDEAADLLVALHADKCHDAILRFHSLHPEGRILLALTGTDIYPAPSAASLESMRTADRILVLQEKALAKIPDDLCDKAVVIVQSARRIAARPEAPSGFLEVCVVGHFRDVKDPLLTARAARFVPEDSTLRIRQAGGILEDKYADLVALEESGNPRYQWLGELDRESTARLIASSDLLVLTSLNEGGARVVGEAFVHGTAVLSTRIEGVTGLLGDDYPGFFPVGDPEALAALLIRYETDEGFRHELAACVDELAPRFDPAIEREKFSKLVAETLRPHPDKALP
jgi:putative glycosyltransferase (TIGR04348 family)